MIMNRSLKPALILLALAGLTACEGIGDGNRPERFFISVASDDGSAFEMTQCIRANVNMIGEFTDGRLGNFTARATWTSNNPDVLLVSDGDTVLPESGNAQLAKGTLIPVHSGTATVTANFLDQTADLLVEVSALGAVRIEPADSTTAIGSRRSQQVFADVDGEDVNMGAFTRWEFDEESASGVIEDIADLNPVSGEFEGLSAGTLTSQSILDFCDIVATASVQIAPIDTLVLDKEFDDRNELITDTTEVFAATATFADTSNTQDLTAQVEYISSRPDIAEFDLSQAAINILRGLVADPAPVEITARFDQTPNDQEDEDFVDSDSTDVSIVDAVLNSIDIAPETLELLGAETGSLTVTGTYDDGARTQLITRHVAFESDNPQIGVFSRGASAGLVVPAVDADNTATVTVTATQLDADGETINTFTDTATVNVTATPEDEPAG